MPCEALPAAEPRRHLPTLDLTTHQPEKIASHLLRILRLADLPSEALDLVLAKSIFARDYATDVCGGAVRNVMRVGQAREAGVLGGDPWQARDDLHRLIGGRHYIAITHGTGPEARVTLLLNRSHALYRRIALWERAMGEAELHAGMMSLVFDSPDARLILGPHVRFTQRPVSAGPLYHEVQSGMDCGLHAINALAGEQVISKAQFQQSLIRRVLDNYLDTGLTEDDFYRNKPCVPELAALYELENGIPPDLVLQLIHEMLPGEIECSPFGADRDTLLTLARDWQGKKSGVIVLNCDHYVALKKARGERIGQFHWVWIDSNNPQQALMTPPEFLKSEPRIDQCVLIGWIAPPKTFKHACCALQ